jgi:hypothetical protein
MYLDKRKLDNHEQVMLLDIKNHVMSLQNIDDEFIPVSEVCQKVRVPECKYNVMFKKISSLDIKGTQNYKACSADIAVKQQLYRTRQACQINKKQFNIGIPCCVGIRVRQKNAQRYVLLRRYFFCGS